MNRGDWLQITILFFITLILTAVIYTFIAEYYVLFAIECTILSILIFLITRKVKL